MANIGNSGDWWMSTRSPQTIFRPAYQNQAMDAFLRENHGIDPAILGAEIGISANHVRAYQRKLGLRKLTGNSPRRPR